LGKKRILEVYLNVIEMGRGVYGIEAAAQRNFKKTAKDLTRQESAMIASCLPNPKIYTIKNNKKFVAGGPKYSWILQQMNNLQEDPMFKNYCNNYFISILNEPLFKLGIRGLQLETANRAAYLPGVS
jgi:hypothetical protein